MDTVAISVDHVSKDFVLPHEKITTIKGMFTSLYKLPRRHAKDTQHALRDVTFDIKKGEFFGIVGRNGSGKSTLLKILAGIYQPTQGSAQVHGKLVPFIELGVGFNPELTGRENVYLNGAMMGFSRRQVRAMYDDIVAFAELERFMDQKLKNYSSGMQVRLAFSMATRAEADILLVDEVLAVGDADFQRKCYQYFRGLKKQKKTVVFVSHDMEAVREYCDRCIMIDQSELVYEGAPDVAAERYTKLFNPTQGQVAGESESKRWGDGAATFGGVHVALQKGYVEVESRVTFHRDMHNPILGVLIKNAAGQTVCGTNSKIMELKTMQAKAGSQLPVRWRLPNIFSSDTYSVEVAVTYADGVTQADWWHDAAFFAVHNVHTTPHIVSPDITMQVG